MDRISAIWSRINLSLFPHLRESMNELTDNHYRLAAILELLRIEDHIPSNSKKRFGRRKKDRRIIARAFVVKVVYQIPTNKLLIERLKNDTNLRMICGWEFASEVPDESTFSRSFAEFANKGILDHIHAFLVNEYVGDETVWHVSRDSTAIEAREKTKKKENKVKQSVSKRKRGRPKKGEERELIDQKRLAKQRTQTADEAIAELPILCDMGTKKDSKGYKMSWIGYKFHIDVIDGDIPVFALTTSASLHDNQVAIPMIKRTSERVNYFYDLMDSAYDAGHIKDVSVELGHVPVIDPNRRRGKAVPMEPDRARRFGKRSSVERVNARLKDDFGGRNLRVRGAPKVHTHLMFGILVIFAEAILALSK